MRILIVDQMGGGAGHIDLYRSLASAGGMQVTLLVPQRSNDGFTTCDIHDREHGSLRIVVGRSCLGGRAHRSVLPGLWELLRKERFDLLFAQAEPESYQAAHAIVGRSFVAPGAKTVLVSWRNIDSAPGVYPFRAAWTHALAEKFTLPRIDGLVTHNREATAIFQARGVRKVTLIPPAVDVDLFSPGRSATPGGRAGRKRFTIGYVGRFVYEKGVDLLLRACARFEMEHEILLTGRGPQEGRLRAQCDGLGISGRVRWSGVASYVSLPDTYRAMDVLVLPSRTMPTWKEQFGRVLIEAMACGVPVIGSDSGEIPTTIGEAGMVFSEGDADGLAAQIARLYNDPVLRMGLGEKARKRAAENFSTSKVGTLYREFFERVLS
jgi:glycosyltransferase involved in cell wall biosynthesis